MFWLCSATEHFQIKWIFGSNMKHDYMLQGLEILFKRSTLNIYM